LGVGGGGRLCHGDVRPASLARGSHFGSDRYSDLDAHDGSTVDCGTYFHANCCACVDRYICTCGRPDLDADGASRRSRLFAFAC